MLAWPGVVAVEIQGVVRFIYFESAANGILWITGYDTKKAQLWGLM